MAAVVVPHPRPNAESFGHRQRSGIQGRAACGVCALRRQVGNILWRPLPAGSHGCAVALTPGSHACLMCTRPQDQGVHPWKNGLCLCVPAPPASARGTSSEGFFGRGFPRRGGLQIAPLFAPVHLPLQCPLACVRHHNNTHKLGDLGRLPARILSRADAGVGTPLSGKAGVRPPTSSTPCHGPNRGFLDPPANPQGTLASTPSSFCRCGCSPGGSRGGSLCWADCPSPCRPRLQGSGLRRRRAAPRKPRQAVRRPRACWTCSAALRA